MTTEDDFQAALDAHPDDWQTRMVFADWLEEQGNPRAEGYRALGALRKWPANMTHDAGTIHWWWHNASEVWLIVGSDGLPEDWFRKLIGKKLGGFWPASAEVVNTRRGCEDVAALAFAKLPAARRNELLNPATVAA